MQGVGTKMGTVETGTETKSWRTVASRKGTPGTAFDECRGRLWPTQIAECNDNSGVIVGRL
jgi:hypothetical protein